jgi:hypothetical protein
MLGEPPDLSAISRALQAESVAYVLIGGLALAMHGGQYTTFDADLAIAFDPENRSKLVKALRPVNPRPMRLTPGANWIWDELCIRQPWSIFQTDVGRVDLIIRLPGVDSFQGLFDRSVLFDIDNAVVRVASIDDLISLKKQSDRPKDQLHLMELYALRELEQEEKA